MRIASYFLLVLSAVVLSPSPAPAQQTDQVGFVVAVRGEVKSLDAKGTPRILSLKSPIYKHDTIQTGAQGRIQILFSDNTIISLGKESRMEIWEHYYKPDQKTGAMRTKIREGVFRVMGGAIAKEAPKNFTTDTPAATIGIRGSLYAGRVAQGTLTVVFEGGRGIDVRNNGGSVAITRPGFGTNIRTWSTPPEKPKRFDTQAMSDLNKDLTVSKSGTQEGTPAPAQSGGEASAPADVSTKASPGDGQQDISGEPASTTANVEPVQDSFMASTDVTAPSELSSIPDAGTPQITPITLSIQDPVWKDPYSGSQVPSSVPPQPTVFSGMLLNALADPDYMVDPNNTMHYTPTPFTLASEPTDGQVSTFVTLDDGTTSNLSFSTTPYNAYSSYSPPDLSKVVTQDYTVNVLGENRIFGMKVIPDALGEFAISDVRGSFVSWGYAYDFAQLAFVGAQVVTQNLPTDGISVYSGPALGFEDITPISQTLKDFGYGDMKMGVNWHNGKVLGKLNFDNDPTSSPDHPERPIFFFGDLNRTTGAVDNFQVIGDRGPVDGDTSGKIPWIQGTTNGFAQFYGSAYQGFGLAGRADVYSINDDMTTRLGIARVEGAGFRQAEDPLAASAGRNVANFAGFTVGIAEDMSNPTIGRRIFMNTNPSLFTLQLDRDLGTVSGELSATDILNANHTLSYLEIGSSHGSAYINDHLFAGIIGDTGNDAVGSYAIFGGLKTYANYLITAGPETLNEYVTWGYWEIAYKDPSGVATNYHVHMPGSYWVAGELTPTAILNAITSTAQYTGGAHGVRIDNSSIMNDLTNGRTSITVDFAPASSNPISGSIIFDQVQMNLDNGLVNKASSSFMSSISITTPVSGSGSANGAIFGPDANGIGGSFNATDVSGNRFIGIFEGKR